MLAVHRTTIRWKKGAHPYTYTFSRMFLTLLLLLFIFFSYCSSSSSSIFSLSSIRFDNFTLPRLSFKRLCACVCVCALYTVWICMGVKIKCETKSYDCCWDSILELYSMWWLNADSSFPCLHLFVSNVMLFVLGMWEFWNVRASKQASEWTNEASRRKKNPSYNFNASVCVGYWKREWKRQEETKNSSNKNAETKWNE